VRTAAVRLAAAAVAAALLLVPLGCGGDGGDGRPELYSTERVRSAFERVGMETASTLESSWLILPAFAREGAGFLSAAIKDPSGTVLTRYDVAAAVFASIADARAALPQAIRDEPGHLVRRFENVVVVVSGLTFRPTSLPPELVAAIRLLRTGEEWSEQG
jgi:hypothetical protein